MAKADSLITGHIDIWTSAIKNRSSQGRGSNKKIELTGIKKLRELILELAVRGQLVPQDPNDEPAAVLLEKIAAEKAQLIKDKKITKAKVLPEIGEGEVLFELPKGWSIAFISQVVSYDKYAIKRGPFGSSLKKSYFVPKGIKVYEQQHAINDNFSLGEYYITEEKFKELSAFQVKPNDLIISCSGTVGKVAIAPSWMEQGIINQALLKITLNENALTNAYFKILFPAFYMQTKTLSDLQGTAQKNMVSVDTLKNEPFPLPSIAEQHRIVAKVDELMALCDQLEQQTEDSITAHKTLVETLLATLTRSENTEAFHQSWARIAEHFDTLFTTEHSIDQLKQTVLQFAVMGKLVPQNPNDEPASVLLEKIAAKKEQLIKDKKIKKQKVLPAISEDEKPFELPNGWEWCRLVEIASFENGDRSSRYPNQNDHVEKGIPFFGAKDMIDGILKFDNDLRYITKEKFSELSNGKLCHKDFVILLRGTVGKTAQFKKNNEFFTGFINAQMLIIRLHQTALDSFLNTFFISRFFQQSIDEKITGSAIKQMPASVLNNLLIPLAPQCEQFRITSKVNELITLCDQLKNRLSEAQITQLHLADTFVKQAVN